MVEKPNQKITLEDLLRLKQAEKPPAHFWPRFERELEQKRLRGLIKARRARWMDAFSRAWKRFLPGMPLAAAACALTLMFASAAHLGFMGPRVGLQRVIEVASSAVSSGPLMGSAPTLLSGHSLEAASVSLNFSQDTNSWMARSSGPVSI